MSTLVCSSLVRGSSSLLLLPPPACLPGGWAASHPPVCVHGACCPYVLSYVLSTSGGVHCSDEVQDCECPTLWTFTEKCPSGPLKDKTWYAICIMISRLLCDLTTCLSSDDGAALLLCERRWLEVSRPRAPFCASRDALSSAIPTYNWQS